MSRMNLGQLIGCGALIVCLSGCASRPNGWGFSWGQGTTERQNSRAAIHDPYPLDEIGPEVVGGRPREFASPQPEPVRNRITEPQFPSSFGFSGR